MRDQWSFQEFINAAASHYMHCVVMPKIRDKLWLSGVGHEDEGSGVVPRDVHDVDRDLRCR